MRGRIEIIEGDIAKLDVDAIVNAANAALAPGGGVCGAIHRAAGPELAAACAAIGHCPTGEARITPGFRLKARHVIHAVGPVWHGGGHGEDLALADAYRASLELASDKGLISIAFPAISTGIYGFPAERAARVAVTAIAAHLRQHVLPRRVVLACFGTQSAAAHAAALAGLEAGEEPAA